MQKPQPNCADLRAEQKVAAQGWDWGAGVGSRETADLREGSSFLFFFTVLGLCCCSRAFSSCSKRGLLSRCSA